MGENSAIEWTDHTFNPWVGCTKVSAACDHCYAESWAKRTGHPELWTGERRRTSVANWKNPIKWNAAAEKRGVVAKVFCASLADVFDNQVPEEWRFDLWCLILTTPWLDWLLLTKRPQNISKMLPPTWHYKGPFKNVWLGTTAENQDEYWTRRHHLLAVDARVHFISYEPALGPISIQGPAVPDWIICGGESGGGKRPMDLAWARSMRDQCKDFGVAFFMKQIDKKQPIPDDLMIREFPKP